MTGLQDASYIAEQPSGKSCFLALRPIDVQNVDVMNGTLGAYPGVSLSLFGLFASRVVLIVLRCLANPSLVLAVQ